MTRDQGVPRRSRLLQERVREVVDELVGADASPPHDVTRGGDRPDQVGPRDQGKEPPVRTVPMVKSGRVAPPLDLKSSRVTDLVQAALHEGLGSVVWTEGEAEIVAHLGQTRVAVLDGLVLVGITLESEQTGRAEIAVPFAVGTEDDLAGTVAVAERVPRGPAALVERWGDAVIAAAWEALVEVADEVARQAGVDTEGNPLTAGALVARRGVLSVVPQARFSFERPAGERPWR
jgi:hypothetical protein